MRSLVGLPASALRVARTRSKKLVGHADSQIRLWRAIYARKRSSATFIAITGSSGKSTTAALIAYILSGVAPTASQIGNSVNRAIVRALQKAPPDNGYFVAEVGSEGPGTLEPSLRIVRPEVGVVTLVRLEHRSAFHSLEAVMQEKAKLIEALPASGLAILNADDPRVTSMAGVTQARVVTFGQTGRDYLVSSVRGEAPGELSLTITHQNRAFEIASRLTGEHQSLAMAAAFSCTHQLGVAPNVIVERIASFPQVYGRCSVHRVKHGPLFIFDAAKAPQHSIQLALDMLAKFHAPRKRIVVGQVSDGGNSKTTYRKVYRAARAIADQVIFVGEHSHRSNASAEDVINGRFVRFDTVKEAAEFLKQSAIADEIIFLKSSSSLHFERLMINFFASVRCWKHACGRKDTCAPLFGGGCGLYEVPFEHHKMARAKLVYPLPTLDFG